MVENVLDPFKIVDNTGVNCRTPRTITPETPWNDTKHLPVLLSRKSAHQWTSWITLYDEDKWHTLTRIWLNVTSNPINWSRRPCDSKQITSSRFYYLIFSEIPLCLLITYIAWPSFSVFRISCTDHELWDKWSGSIGLVQQVNTFTRVQQFHADLVQILRKGTNSPTCVRCWEE